MSDTTALTVRPARQPAPRASATGPGRVGWRNRRARRGPPRPSPA